MSTIFEPLQQFASGAKRSNQTGKGRYDLITPHGLRRLAIRYEEGVEHKGERNWEKGFPVSRAISSAIRHIMQYLAGCRKEDHIAAAAWQMFCIMHFEETFKDNKEILDTPCQK